MLSREEGNNIYRDSVGIMFLDSLLRTVRRTGVVDFP